MVFADRLQASIDKTKSCLVAGCDPVIERFPKFLVEDADRQAITDQDFIDHVLGQFTEAFLAAVTGHIAAIKPNAAFFEQYGLAGIQSLHRLCQRARAVDIPIILDAKRGDIGATAAAYSAACIGRTFLRGSRVPALDADAVTVNPFMGFDTLEPFIQDCLEYEKGVFILVRTSNSGAADIQGDVEADKSVSNRIAAWIAERANQLMGQCGWSGLGAVVGATYPKDAAALRKKMPTSFFLIPGLGAQGGQASEAIAGFAKQDNVKTRFGGGVVNVSRGLLEGPCSSAQELVSLISKNVERYNQELQQSLEGRPV